MVLAGITTRKIGVGKTTDNRTGDNKLTDKNRTGGNKLTDNNRTGFLTDNNRIMENKMALAEIRESTTPETSADQIAITEIPEGKILITEIIPEDKMAISETHEGKIIITEIPEEKMAITEEIIEINGQV
jgi:hypothetical protein